MDRSMQASQQRRNFTKYGGPLAGRLVVQRHSTGEGAAPGREGLGSESCWPAGWSTWPAGQNRTAATCSAQQQRQWLAVEQRRGREGGPGRAAPWARWWHALVEADYRGNFSAGERGRRCRSWMSSPENFTGNKETKGKRSNGDGFDKRDTLRYRE